MHLAMAETQIQPNFSQRMSFLHGYVYLSTEGQILRIDWKCSENI